MASVGISRKTGKWISGWARTLESLHCIIFTSIGERTQRRLFGSPAEGLVDKPSTPETVMDIYMAAAEAIRPRIVEGRQYGEPCFGLSRIQMGFGPDGRTTVLLSGFEYPNGHKGDFTVSVARDVTINF